MTTCHLCLNVLVAAVSHNVTLKWKILRFRFSLHFFDYRIGSSWQVLQTNFHLPCNGGSFQVTKAITRMFLVQQPLCDWFHLAANACQLVRSYIFFSSDLWLTWSRSAWLRQSISQQLAATSSNHLPLIGEYTFLPSNIRLSVHANRSLSQRLESTPLIPTLTEKIWHEVQSSIAIVYFFHIY